MEGIEPLGIQNIVETLISNVPHAGTFIWALFGLTLLYAIGHALVFGYHWHTYNIAPGPFLKRTYVFYYGGMIFFTLILFLSTLAIVT